MAKNVDRRLNAYGPLSATHPAAAQHALVTGFVREVIASPRFEQSWYKEFALKDFPAGQVILNTSALEARAIVVAAVAQVRHWNEEAARMRAEKGQGVEYSPDWGRIWGPARQTQSIIKTLLRRKLPLTKTDLLDLIAWTCESATGWHSAPVAAIVKALERHSIDPGFDDELTAAAREFAKVLRGARDKNVNSLATIVEQFCKPESKSPKRNPPKEYRAEPKPSIVGARGVMCQLKALAGVPDAGDPEVATTDLAPDHFALRYDSPLRPHHQILSALFNEFVGRAGYAEARLKGTRNGNAILKTTGTERGSFVLAAAERAVSAITFGASDLDDTAGWQSRYSAMSISGELALLPFELDREQVFDFLLYAAFGPVDVSTVDRVLDSVERIAKQSFSEGERYVLHLVRAAMIAGPPLGEVGETVMRLDTMIGDGSTFFLMPGEFWTDALNTDVAAKPPTRRRAWVNLLKICLGATAARPPKKWLANAAKHVDDIGSKSVSESLRKWLPLVARGRAVPRLGRYAGDSRAGGHLAMHEENATCLRGLLWLIPALAEGAALVREISATAQTAYRKVPGIGPRAVKVGNAAVYALSKIASEEAVGQLALLKARVKFGTAQKEIEKAFNAAAAATGIPREDIEEMGVPSYGLEEVGHRREKFGDATAELIVDGRDAAIHWSRADGKPLKSIPAKVKADFKDNLKELQQAAKDIGAMLPAQVERLDSAFLLQKTWRIESWRERYVDHPLVGTLARRLIWIVDGVACVPKDGELVAIDGKAIKATEGSTVRLWHPIGVKSEQILAWREKLAEWAITQPFKQAHREIYVLTDAERRTDTYSNRFAAHILRQHQFNALCAARGWKNKLRLLVDDSYPPASRTLPNWGLRAEYWIEGVGTDYSTDTNESGVFHRIATDQVRFYRTAAAQNYAHAGGGGYTTHAQDAGTQNINEPMALDQIPPLVFSEIMRDVDLFVGVASVGNDPNWSDGGPEGRYLDYWNRVSFGDLTESAKTRKAVLETLLPRLTRIRDRCRLEDKFLIVRGELRTYKIHLGSGNILMEPNDQYLCIVPDRKPAPGGEKLFLPFEGDSTLAIVLSKAFMLAEDTSIKDPSITRQIRP